MNTLKNNLSSIRNNKENYLSPNCEVYDLEIEGVICGSSTDNATTAETNEITYGGGFPGTSFWNTNN